MDNLDSFFFKMEKFTKENGFKERILFFSKMIIEEINLNFDNNIPRIKEVTEHIMFSGGKHLRPILFLLSSLISGGQPSVRLATMFEYLHVASLLHDDVVDNSNLRRGCVSSRIKYGNDSVVLVGDFLFSKSYSLASEVPDINFLKVLIDCTRIMAEGQVLELVNTENWELSKKIYFDIIKSKTAVLIATACKMGALYAKINSSIVNALYNYGLNLGIAYQLVDDILDYVGESHEFGKPVGNDLVQGRVTFPFIYVRDTVSVNIRNQLLNVLMLKKKEIKTFAKIKKIVQDNGGIEATYLAARSYAKRSFFYLSQIMGREKSYFDMKVFLFLIGYVLKRKK